MPVQSEYVGQRSRQKIVDGYFAATGFVHHWYAHSVAKRGFSIHHNQVGVFYIRTLAHIVIGHVVVNVFNKYIVADGAIVQTTVVKSAMLAETAVHFEDFVKFPQFDGTRKMYIGYILWCKFRIDCYVAPVIGTATVYYKGGNFLFGKFSVIFHK